MPKRESERGSASVEQAGLAALVALLLVAAIAAVAAGGEVDAGRRLGGALGRRLVCAPRLPDGCRHHSLVPAYGWPLARLARALAPAPEALPGPSGLPLVPVDFRRCRSQSCAVAAGPHLTASNRRVTAFTELVDRRQSEGWVELVYWLYRPTLGWQRLSHRATQADVESRERHRRARARRPRSGPARDPARPQPLQLPAHRAPTLAVARSQPLSGLVELSQIRALRSASFWCLVQAFFFFPGIGSVTASSTR